MPEDELTTEDGRILTTEDGQVLITERIVSALSDVRYEWRTTDGVSRDTGVAADDVLQFIEARPDLFIRSRIPDKNGNALFATREHYRATHNVLERFADVYRTTHT